MVRWVDRLYPALDSAPPPGFGFSFSFYPMGGGAHGIETEACCPVGRRVETDVC